MPDDLPPDSCDRYPYLERALEQECQTLGARILKARPKECQRFRALCDAVGFTPPADLKPGEQEAWWLSIYGMEEKSHELLCNPDIARRLRRSHGIEDTSYGFAWGLILARIKAEPQRLIAAQAVVAAVAKVVLEYVRKKDATILRQADEITLMSEREAQEAKAVEDNTRDYIPAARAQTEMDFPTYKHLTRWLAKHPDVRTHKPSKNRLLVHAGDLLAAKANKDEREFEATNVPGEVLADEHAQRLEQHKAEVRARRTARLASRA